MKKVQVKLTIPAPMRQDLENIAALTGDSIQTIIKGYVRDALYVPKHGPPQSPPPRAHRVSGIRRKRKEKIADATNTEPVPPDSTTPHPADFDPPERITKQAQLNRSEALRIFRDWATAKDKRFTDWNDAFAIACNGWIPEARPDVREYPRQALTKRDNRVMASDPKVIADPETT
jgi:hypothetical protein